MALSVVAELNMPSALTAWTQRSRALCTTSSRGGARHKSRPATHGDTHQAKHMTVHQHNLLLHGRSATRPTVCSATTVLATTFDEPASGLEEKLRALSGIAANFFPVWLIIACFLALWRPALFLWFSTDYVTVGLALTMLSMGTTLTLEDFTGVLKMPGLVMLGAALQYTIMPTMGYLVSRLAGLPTALAIGVCLVASCPGGVASNVVTYLARADVPLSVMMTTASTLAAVVTTPFLVQLLVGSMVPVDPAALLSSLLQVVLLPVGIGAFLNQTFPAKMQRVSHFAPLLAVSMTVLICASVMAQNAAAVRLASGKLILAVFTLHAGGFLLGYVVAKLLGVGERQARTMSIEVGMQNSTLGAVLAAVHFSCDPLTAVPCAISACMHSLLGSSVAAVFRFRDAHGPRGAAQEELEVLPAS